MTDREYFIRLIELAQMGNIAIQSGDIADKLIKNGVIFPKVGRWEQHCFEIECSICGAEALRDWRNKYVYSKYCPNCGAKMLNK